MKKFLPLAAALAVSVTAIPGCTTYGHTRFDAESGKMIENTHLLTPFLTKSAISGLKTRVTDKHGTSAYTRSVGLESGTSQADVDGINALNALIGNAVLQGLKATSPVPTP